MEQFVIQAQGGKGKKWGIIHRYNTFTKEESKILKDWRNDGFNVRLIRFDKTAQGKAIALSNKLSNF